MSTIAITGGIGSGKTSFLKNLCVHIDADVFEADHFANQLLENSPSVRKQIEAQFGLESYQGEKANRPFLRTQIYSDKERRKQLEGILHPLIREKWVALAEQAHCLGRKFLADIPLLFETGGQSLCDFVIVVACPVITQLSRLVSGRKMDEESVRKIIRAQLPLEEKVRRADQVVWNDGSPQLLMKQATVVAQYLTERYG